MASLRLLLVSAAQFDERVEIQQKRDEAAEVANLQGLCPRRRGGGKEEGTGLYERRECWGELDQPITSTPAIFPVTCL